MKTEDRWVIPVDLTNLEINTLPVIGNSHITSILSTLDTKSQIHDDPNLATLSALQTDYKLTTSLDTLPQTKVDGFSLNQSIKVPKKLKKIKTKTQYYIFCNFCPFLCLTNKRINEHLATVHENNKVTTLVPEYRCPACPNTFSHLSSLDSHLTHDHYVSNKSERKIIVHLIEKCKKYATYVPRSSIKKFENAKENGTSNGFVERKDDIVEAVHHDSHYDVTNDNTATLLLTTDLPVSIANDISGIDLNGHVVTLPTLDLTTTHAEQMINSSLLQESIHLCDDNITAVNKIYIDDTANFNSDKSPINSDIEIINKTVDDIKISTKNDDDVDKSIVDQHPSDALHRCLKPLCNVRLQNIDKMVYHQKCHTSTNEGAPFVCPECSVEFNQWKPLTGHLWRIHRVDMELYCCDQCDYRSFSLSKLNNTHKLIHGEARNYACPDCDRAFKNIKQLRNHRVLHKRNTETGDVNSFSCDLCSRVFSEKRKLKQHMDSVHMKLKPFLCSYCGYKGATRSALKVHIRQHTGEKPFICEHCDFASSDHNSLRRHKLRHSGKRPYRCVHCEYSCIQSNTYKVHLKTKHPGQEKDLLFACAHCSFRSVNKDIYLSHQMTAHGE